MTEKCFVVEITPVVADDGSTQTFLFGTQAFATKPTDTPANTSVRPFLKNPGSLRRELFSGARVTGAIRPSYGNIVLANPAPDEESAGELDAWFDYGLSGSKVVVRYGTIGDDYPSAWTTVYIAYAQSFVADLNEITIRLRDRLQLLEQPVVTDGFAGTGGLEGTGGISKKKQFVASDPGYFPPILVDVNRQIYFVQSTSDAGFGRLSIGITNTFQVFDNGVNITRQTPNYSSETELLNSSPSQGFARFYFGPPSRYLTGWSNGPVYFRLGSPPAGDLRVFGSGYATDEDSDRWGSALGGPFRAEVLALRAGLQKADLDSDRSAFLPAGAILVDDDSTYNDVLSDAALTYQGWYGFTRLDKFRSGGLNDPEDDGYYYGVDQSIFSQTFPLQPTVSKYEFNTSNVQNLRREPVNGMEAPVWKVSVRAGKTWPSQIANGATSVMKDYLTRDVWTAFQGVSTQTLLQNPGAVTAELDIRGRNFQNQFSIRIWLERYFVLYGGRRDFFTFTTPMTEDVLNLELTDVVTLKTPRFGLSAGKKFRIVGIEIQAAAARGPVMKFTLWGGEIGKFTGYSGGPGSSVIQPPGTTPSVANPLLLQAQMGAFTGDFAGSVITPSASTAGSEASYMGDFISQFFGEVAESLVCDHDFANVTLLLYFDGANNSTTFTDSSSYARTVTRNGNTVIKTDQSKFGGSSGYFDGTGDYLSCATSADFGFGTGDFTMECWVKTSSNNFVFFDWRTTAHPGVFFHNPTGVGYFEQGGLSANTNQSINDNNWHHLAFVRASNTLLIFIDGTQYGSSWSITSNHGTSRPMRVGIAYDGTTGFTGYLDDVRITKGVARYTSNFTVPSEAYPNIECVIFNEVKLLLHFNGADSSTTFTDSSSVSRTITRNGDAKISTTQSKFNGSSGYFDGTGDYLSAASSADFSIFANDFTIEAWVYYSSTSGNKCLFEIGTLSTNRANVSLVSGNFVFYTEVTGLGSGTRISGAAPAINTWHHIALSKSGTTFRLFVNGTSAGTSTTTAYPTTANLSLYIGSNISPVGSYWSGYIDEFRLIKGSAIYTSNFTPPTAPFPDS